jgi:Uncharacterised nucleotidyltransferase
MNCPSLPQSTFDSVTETLALWLARGGSAVQAAVQRWNTSDWQAALWIAYWQGAMPLWAARLEEAGPVTESARATIEQVAALSHARTTRLLDAVREMVVGLAALDIEIAPLKGARLAPFYYRPASLRSMGDIDVLLRRVDVDAACRWMEAHEYIFYSRSEEDVIYLRGSRLPEVWHPDNVHPVEPHFRLREEFGGAGLGWEMDADAWRSASRQAYLGVEARLISPMFLLRHLCAHASSDIFIRRGKIQQLEDIARVAQSMSADGWHAFAASVAPSFARFEYPALALTARYYTQAIPAAILEQLRAQVKPKLRAWVGELTLAAASESNLTPRSGLGVPLLRLLTESPAETTRALSASLLPPRWNLMKRYPRLAASRFYPLCYVLINADRAWHILSRR